MVFEQLFKEKWLEKKAWHAIFLGIFYSIVGILSAKLIFGSNPGLMAVAFTSILLIPSLNQLLSYEENVEIREKKFSIKLLFKDHLDIFEIYFYLFLGVFIVFALASILLPQEVTLQLFEPQLAVAGITGRAVTSGFFMSILLNNIKVLIVCLLLSIIYGAGSILFLTWNAAVWGAVFGFVAKHSASMQGENSFFVFFCLILPVLPHMFTEALSYLSAAIAGGVLSKATIREKLFSAKFHHIMTDALIIAALGFALVVIGAYLEVYWHGVLDNLMKEACQAFSSLFV